MSDYTPTTEAIRGRIIQRGIGWGFYGLDEFDRWLATHDAEKRAEWEASSEQMSVKGQSQPAEDEREALAEMDEFLDGIFTPSGRELLMTVIAAAGYSKGPRPITDEMVYA